jgi:hypothetical protein
MEFGEENAFAGGRFNLIPALLIYTSFSETVTREEPALGKTERVSVALTRSGRGLLALRGGPTEQALLFGMRA